MANKKVFTDESLATFVDEIKSYTDDAVSTKANASHTHTIANVTNLQTTLDGKQATITGGATTITSSNLTASRALVSDSSGKVAVSAVTSTELGYLDGVTSAIQTQLDGKAASSHGTHVSYGTSATAVGSTASAGSATTVSRSDHTHSLSKSAVTTALGYTPPTTNTTYDIVSTTADGLAPKRDGSTTKFLRADGIWAVPPDTDTTYTFATGDSNGQIKVTPSGGSAQNISVKGLGSAAYTASTAYATAAQGTNSDSHIANTSNPHSVTKSQVGLGNVTNDKQMPIAGGTFTGNVKAYTTNRNTSGGCLRNIAVTNNTGGSLVSTNRITMWRK